jgi:predicted HAD superfamily Cof-like phosphohydrolase
MQAIFDEIQRSNMSKLDENGKPIYREDGKVLKGANYTRPDIASILAERR